MNQHNYHITAAWALGLTGPRTCTCHGTYQTTLWRLSQVCVLPLQSGQTEGLFLLHVPCRGQNLSHHGADMDLNERTLCSPNEESQPPWNHVKAQLQPLITHVELEVRILLIDEKKIPSSQGSN